MLSATMAEGKTKNGCPRRADLAAQVAAMQAPIDALHAALLVFCMCGDVLSIRIRWIASWGRVVRRCKRVAWDE